MALTLNLVNKVLKSQNTAAGDEVYQGGEVHEPNRGQIGVFTMISDTFSTVTDTNGLDSASTVLTIIFFAAQHGPHGGGGQGGGGGGQQTRQAPENMTLEGAPNFEGPTSQAQPRAVARMLGSVSAASPAFHQNIGHQFELLGNVLKIH
jgi:hypothetical protein